MKKIFMCGVLFFSCVYVGVQAVAYHFINEPIDVIIPCTEKDLATLDLCIRGIRRNCDQIRRVIVVSDYPITNKAEWFDEKKFPFNKKEIAYYLVGCDADKAEEFLLTPKCRAGWYLQQLLKLYAVYVIPDLSSNILILDSDTIFLNPVKFIAPSGAGLYNTGKEYHRPYFEHMNRFIPGLSRISSERSGICHHMLMQRSVLDDLFQDVEAYHETELWKAFCLCVDKNEINVSGASEYEIYFNFVFSKTNQTKIRPLKWENIDALNMIDADKSRNLSYVSCHDYLRVDSKKYKLH